MRPKFWSDVEVCNLLTSLHRTMTEGKALAICEAQFGSDRTPSQSALNRYWVKLDSAFGPNDTHAVRRLNKRRNG